MSDTIIYGLTGEYRWVRRPVWFWQVRDYTANGWSLDPRTFWLRPTVILKQQRPDDE